MNLLVDKELYNLFEDLDFKNDIGLIEADKQVKELLQKYFYSYKQIASVVLVTEDHSFGYWQEDITFDHSFFNSEIYRIAEEKKGVVSIYQPIITIKLWVKRL